MKRIAAILLALALVLSLCACGSSKTAESGPVVKIGVYEPASGDNGAGGKQETLGVEYAYSVSPTV